MRFPREKRGKRAISAQSALMGRLSRPGGLQTGSVRITKCGVICPYCQKTAYKCGTYRNRQRYRCQSCRKNWTEGARIALPDEPDDGLVTAEKMRKVLGQDPQMDSGPTEKVLRQMLAKGHKSYLEKIDELDGRADRERAREQELGELRARNAELLAENERLKVQHVTGEGSDDGAKRARELIGRILKEFGDAEIPAVVAPAGEHLAQPGIAL